ncbi:MAG: GntR family transcriptional regulator [Pseudomonadales bacterium]|nr:GntR family transcriptional regulator [Pseudomonadales bacterium]
MTSTNTLSNEIAGELRAEILRGHYHPGERLPSERDLSARFGASRGAIREALSQLRQLGLIDGQLGGARVRRLKDARIAVLGPLLSLNDTPDPKLIGQVIKTFGALAVLTAEEAVASASQDELNRLRDIVVSIDSLAGDSARQQEKWRELISSLSEVADNLVVQLIRNDLRAQFVDQMTELGIHAAFRKRVMTQILAGLKQGLSKRDIEKTGAAVKLYFEELGLIMQQALADHHDEYRKQAS